MPKRVAIFSQIKLTPAIEFCILELVFIKFHFEQTILNFWTKSAQERCLWSKKEKLSIIIEFPLFKLVLVPNFSLKKILIFLIRFTQKEFFWSKTKKVNCTYFLHNSRFFIILDLYFWIKFEQKGISSRKQKK